MKKKYIFFNSPTLYSLEAIINIPNNSEIDNDLNKILDDFAARNQTILNHVPKGYEGKGSIRRKDMDGKRKH